MSGLPCKRFFGFSLGNGGFSQRLLRERVAHSSPPCRPPRAHFPLGLRAAGTGAEA